MISALIPQGWITPERIWLGLGFFAQALFGARFLVQWIASERAKASVVPIHFWYLSLGGGLLLLAYAIHRGDPVFMLGQLMGNLVYLRNLYLIRRTARLAAALEGTGSSSGGGSSH